MEETLCPSGIFLPESNAREFERKSFVFRKLLQPLQTPRLRRKLTETRKREPLVIQHSRRWGWVVCGNGCRLRELLCVVEKLDALLNRVAGFDAEVV